MKRKRTRFVNKHSFSANIIFNLGKLNLSIEDSKHFDIATYIELIEIEKELYKGSDSRSATQSDIDRFFM